MLPRCRSTRALDGAPCAVVLPIVLSLLSKKLRARVHIIVRLPTLAAAAACAPRVTHADTRSVSRAAPSRRSTARTSRRSTA